MTWSWKRGLNCIMEDISDLLVFLHEPMFTLIGMAFWIAVYIMLMKACGN